MDLLADEHVRAVIELMQERVPAVKLIGVAEALPQMARLLWGHVPQEPVTPLSIGGSQPTANVFSPENRCADGGSGEATGDPVHQ
jgi:hypothetical protein